MQSTHQTVVRLQERSHSARLAETKGTSVKRGLPVFAATSTLPPTLCMDLSVYGQKGDFFRLLLSEYIEPHHDFLSSMEVVSHAPETNAEALDAQSMYSLMSSN